MPRSMTTKGNYNKRPGLNRLWVASDGVRSIRVEAANEKAALAVARYSPRFPKPEKIQVQEIENGG